jgi:hypothetical protein
MATLLKWAITGSKPRQSGFRRQSISIMFACGAPTVFELSPATMQYQSLGSITYAMQNAGEHFCAAEGLDHTARKSTIFRLLGEAIYAGPTSAR